MKINRLPSKTHFGQISSKAIDVIRKHSEGYNIEVDENVTKESYDLNSKYKLLKTNQIETLKALTSRASKLNRSLITQSGLSEGLDVRYRNTSHHIETFEFDPKQKGNGNYFIQILKSAVEFAENIEKDTSNRILFTEQGYINKGQVNNIVKRVIDRFRTKKDNSILQSVYNDTVAIEYKKTPHKRKDK